jgi:DNA mismatch endonuclease (patch repair protein)
MKHQKLDTTDSISQRMSRVRLKKGKAETMLAKTLWHRGYRYRMNYKKIPGSPDIAFTKQKVAVFVDGEFWHGYDWENRKEKLKNNREYWIEKINENMSRDMKNARQLDEMGWRMVRFWEKEVLRDMDKCVEKCIQVLDAK